MNYELESSINKHKVLSVIYPCPSDYFRLQKYVLNKIIKNIKIRTFHLLFFPLPTMLSASHTIDYIFSTGMLLLIHKLTGTLRDMVIT